MSDKSSSSSGGIGFIGLLTIVFITLKLTGYINWSWVWVFSPIWGAAVLGIGALMFFLGCLLAGALGLDWWDKRKSRKAWEKRMKARASNPRIAVAVPLDPEEPAHREYIPGSWRTPLRRRKKEEDQNGRI